MIIYLCSSDKNTSDGATKTCSVVQTVSKVDRLTNQPYCSAGSELNSSLYAEW